MEWSWVDRIMGDWQRSLGDGVDDDIIEDASRSQGTEQQTADTSDCGGHPSVQQPATPVRRSGRGRGRSSTHGAAKRILLAPTIGPASAGSAAAAPRDQTPHSLHFPLLSPISTDNSLILTLLSPIPKTITLPLSHLCSLPPLPPFPNTPHSPTFGQPLDAKSSEFELVNPLPLLPVLGSLDHRHRQPLQSSSKEGPSKVSLPSFHFLDTATTRPPKSARPSRVAPLASHNI
ncbi:unnamed protein product [Closterium sp. NIES-65]|nr:unnamed protein product [Closterium sp. NIES-65]